MLNFEVSAAAFGDDGVVYESQEIDQYTQHLIEAINGSVTVQVIIAGSTYTGDITVDDMSNAATGANAEILSIAAGGVGRLNARVKKLRVLQDGATNAGCRVAHGAPD